MTDNAFGPRDAVAVLESVEGYEEALRRRTEGLTYVLWGIVSPAISVTYALGETTVPAGDEWLFSLFWMPWVLAGCVGTYALWRTAAIPMGLARQQVRSAFRTRALLVGALFLLAGLGGWLLAAPGHVDGAAYPTLAIGLFTLVMSGVRTRFDAVSPGARTVGLVAGALILAAGVALAFAAWTPLAKTLSGAGIVGAVYLGAGLAHALQG